MTAQLPMLLVAFSLACSGDKHPSAGSQADSGSAKGNCDITVSATYPEDGGSDHYYRDPVRFLLSEPDGSATVVTDIPGTTTTESGGLVVVFTPDVPLAPSTSYTMGLDYCYGTPEISFSTSSYGAPLDEGVTLEGQAYALDLTTGEYVVGENAGELLNAIFTRHVLFELGEIEGDTISTLAAVSTKPDEPLEQDLCARTVALDGVDISDSPYFSVDISELSFGAHDGELRFTRFAVDGTIAPSGGRIGGIAFEATMAVDEISNVLPEVGGVEALCQMAENLGIPCDTCETDDFALCITVASEHILAQGADLDLQQVTEAGVAEGCE